MYQSEWVERVGGGGSRTRWGREDGGGGDTDWYIWFILS